MKIECQMKPFIPEMRLFHSREKCLAWCEKKGVDVPLVDTDAQTFDVDGIQVVLFEGSSDDVWWDALLIHEAYHVVCNHLQNIGEELAGEEITAYMLQVVSGALIYKHHKWLRKRKKDGGKH